MIFAPTPKAAHLKKIVERCIHPYVIYRMLVSMLWYWLRGYSRIVLDIPLLFEVNLTWMCSTTVLIDIPDNQVQLDRLLRRNPDMPASEAKNRIAAQFSLERKRKLANHVVMNDGNLEDFKDKLKRLFDSPAVKPKHNSLWILPCLVVIFAMFWICWYRTPVAPYS
jgi:dephospho-CoA kinase